MLTSAILLTMTGENDLSSSQTYQSCSKRSKSREAVLCFSSAVDKFDVALRCFVAVAVVVVVVVALILLQAGRQK
ncbi:Hypothetical predicted protein [Octopus vulgaris]|uniref:Uncharacterized protein n=1 Tax=Octopus vulgaris TaxID=6645 RepID=A0AA36ASL4_OCTVU|nr:Hypothetical predicted protein [Octopus vulgaris]